jgi:hypothetical protein
MLIDTSLGLNFWASNVENRHVNSLRVISYPASERQYFSIGSLSMMRAKKYWVAPTLWPSFVMVFFVQLDKDDETIGENFHDEAGL